MRRQFLYICVWLLFVGTGLFFVNLEFFGATLLKALWAFLFPFVAAIFVYGVYYLCFLAYRILRCFDQYLELYWKWMDKYYW